jgi:hypothetical protein
MITLMPLFDAHRDSNEEVLLSMIATCGPLPDNLYDLADIDSLREKSS